VTRPPTCPWSTASALPPAHPRPNWTCDHARPGREAIREATGISEIEYELRSAFWAGWRKDPGVEALLPSSRGWRAVGSDW